MKKIGVLNAQLSRIIASMGHTDRLVIGDLGLPIPRNTEVIDLALTGNVPRFLETLEVVLSELQVEQVIIAEEMKTISNGVYKEVSRLLADVDIKRIPHEEFKAIIHRDANITFVRTGEMTPYANIILVSGVTFG